MLPYISTNNTSELNDLIYAGAKVVCEKLGSPLKVWKECVNQDGKFEKTGHSKTTQ